MVRGPPPPPEGRSQGSGALPEQGGAQPASPRQRSRSPRDTPDGLALPPPSEGRSQGSGALPEQGHAQPDSPGQRSRSPRATPDGLAQPPPSEGHSQGSGEPPRGWRRLHPWEATLCGEQVAWLAPPPLSLAPPSPCRQSVTAPPHRLRNGSHDGGEALQDRKAWVRHPHARRVCLDFLPRCESSRLAPSKRFHQDPRRRSADDPVSGMARPLRVG